jgi:hypothetical protein
MALLYKQYSAPDAAAVGRPTATSCRLIKLVDVQADSGQQSKLHATAITPVVETHTSSTNLPVGSAAAQTTAEHHNQNCSKARHSI